MPPIPNNITIWRIFDDDEDILNFLALEKTYDNEIINEHEHENQ